MISPATLFIPVTSWLSSIEKSSSPDIDKLRLVGRPILAARWFLSSQGFLNLHSDEFDHQLFVENKSRWMRWKDGIKEIFDFLAASKYPCILLKGVDLSQSLYPDEGIRSLGDIDLLVKPKDILPIVNLLVEKGYKISSHEKPETFKLWSSQEDTLPNEISLFNPGGLHIELHQHLVSSNIFQAGYPLKLDLIWERSKEIDTWNCHSKFLRVLSTSDYVTYLILHIANHGFGLLAIQSFLDLDLMIRDRMDYGDWEKVKINIVDWRLSTAANFVLTFCKHYLDTPIPNNFIDELPVNAWSRLLLSLIIQPEHLLTGEPSLGMKYPTFAKIAAVERFTDQVIIFFKVLFPERKTLKKQSGMLSHWRKIFQAISRGD